MKLHEYLHSKLSSGTDARLRKALPSERNVDLVLENIRDVGYEPSDIHFTVSADGEVTELTRSTGPQRMSHQPD